MPNFRVYFNRRSEHPTVWSIDSGSQASELNVKAFYLHRCSAVSHWDPDIPPNPDTPCAWLEVYNAVMEMRDGAAHFFHDPAWRQPPLTQETNSRIRELP